MREVVVIGGGLAGAACAIRLARAGVDVLLLERSRGPHDKVCGEFLSFEAQADLADLGIDLHALGAVPLATVAAARGPRRIQAPLGFTGQSLSRRILDEALLDRAVADGAEVRRGVRVTGVEARGEGWLVDSAEPVPARSVVLATGKHDLRGRSRPDGTQGDLIGFKTYWTLPDSGRLAGLVELHLFPGGYAGLQPAPGGRANLCLVVRRRTFAELGGRWEQLLGHLLASCPHLTHALQGAEPSPEAPLAVARIPYGLVQREARGLWRLGDQAAVIPSFTGEGMSIALHSAREAARAILARETPEVFQARLARGLARQVRRSTLASQAMVAAPTQAILARLARPALLRGVLAATRLAPRLRPVPLGAIPHRNFQS